MHWCDRRAAKANLGQALAAIGWELYGWTGDQSDSMTDYYCPEHWDGIATKAGTVVVVDYSAKYPRAITDDSGKQEYKSRLEPAGRCEHCLGSGVDPAIPMTLTDARANPRGFNALWDSAHVPGGHSMFPDFVSPLHFRDDGQCKCPKCHGSGELTVIVSDPFRVWPTFQANPDHKLWHVERSGRILGSGVGLQACARYTRADEVNEAAAKLAAKIDTLVAERPKRAPVVESFACSVTVTENEERDGVEVRFESRPAAEVLASLKAGGFRWSRPQGLWYARRNPKTLELARSLA